ncbi:NUDIX hydrolase [Tessaracoccus massiliensis]|uniref:NUDIX hydrolase n=1 Tax=Tessaracoccus massiliensis TaxID=1522311 RepID=UPI00058E51FC|nr:NUDIX domain-containing protein [Tessaracoccus massiliensis]
MAPDARSPDFFVVSVTLRNIDGDLLMVRKRGTHRFMLPGGKVEPGETHLQAILREVEEEVGLTLEPAAVELLGHWTAGAANEPGLVISSDVFIAPLPGDPRASGEIEELRWLPISAEIDYDADPTLSPMLTEHVVPALVTLRDVENLQGVNFDR